MKNGKLINRLINQIKNLTFAFFATNFASFAVKKNFLTAKDAKVSAKGAKFFYHFPHLIRIFAVGLKTP